MSKIKRYLIIFFIILIILVITIVGIVLLNKDSDEPVVETNTATNEEDNVLIVGMNNNSEDDNVVTEPEPEPSNVAGDSQVYLDPADLTTGVENLNMEIGTLNIPKTKLKTQVYCRQSSTKMEKMPCFLYTSGGINKPGITCITGHNRRNGKLFSNNKKLEKGDIFYFTDYEGVELKYTIYDKYVTDESDTRFLNIESDKPVMALSCCTDANNNERIIILGRAEEY